LLVFLPEIVVNVERAVAKIRMAPDGGAQISLELFFQLDPAQLGVTFRQRLVESGSRRFSGICNSSSPMIGTTSPFAIKSRS
jgi:hypothetical protein